MCVVCLYVCCVHRVYVGVCVWYVCCVCICIYVCVLLLHLLFPFLLLFFLSLIGFMSNHLHVHNILLPEFEGGGQGPRLLCHKLREGPRRHLTEYEYLLLL